MDIDTQWKRTKETWPSTWFEVLGKKKCQQKEYISADNMRKNKNGVRDNS